MAIDLNELAAAIGQLIIRFRLKRDLAATWTSNNTVLLDSEIGYETDTSKIKIGDGTTPWVSLAYWGNPSGSGGTDLTSKNAGAGIDISEFQPTTGGGDGTSGDDANFASRLCVLHFDGTSGDTVSYDTGPLGLTVASHPMSGGSFGGTLVTTQPIFGTASASGRWGVENTPSMNLGSGDWMFEGWAYPTDGVTIWSSALMSVGDNSAFRSGVSPNYAPEGVFIILNSSGLLSVDLTDSTGTTIAKQFAWDHKSGSTQPFQINHQTYFCVQKSGTVVTVYGGDRQLYINEFTEPGAVAGVSGRYEWDVGSIVLKDTTTPMIVGGIPSDELTDNESWTFPGTIDEVRVSLVAERTSAGTGVLTVSTVADNDAPTAAFPSNATPITDDGDPYPLITNTRAGIVLAGAVDTYSHLPMSGLTAGDAYLVYADELVYVWSGSAWPTDGTGLDLRAHPSTSNITPDSHPEFPTPYDDEFEYGSAIDTTGVRRSSANSWTLHTSSGQADPIVAQGAMAVATVSGTSSVMLQSAPGEDCAFVVRGEMRPTANNGGIAVGFYNSTNGRILFGLAFNGGTTTTVVQRGTLDGSSWAYTFSSNVLTDAALGNTFLKTSVRIKLTGTTILFSWSISGHDAQWSDGYEEDVSAWLGAITHVAVFASGTTDAICDHFRRVE